MIGRAKLVHFFFSLPRGDIVKLEDIPRILQELEEEERNPADPSAVDNESDLSDEDVACSEHNSESEECGSDSDESVVQYGSHFLGKDKTTKWYKTPISKSTKTSGKNLVKFVSGAKGVAKNIETYSDSFMSFFSVTMIDTIVLETNKHIQNHADKYSRGRNCLPTSRKEILALIGILYLLGLKKAHHANVEELWAKDGTGMIILRATMSYRRFLFLLRCIRFDDRLSRDQRRATDKLAAIRVILDQFVYNCRNNYEVSEHVTVDEMLVPFRGRCSWIQYMPSKPAKYGLKFFALCDAKLFYTSHIELYVGKQPAGPYETSIRPTDIVLRLTEHLKKSNRNVTTDNWYTSVELANSLLSRGLTLVGTMRKNKREIPPSFLPAKEKLVGSSQFGYQKEATLLSYTTKKNKGVILLSTMHEEGNRNLPEMIDFYNHTKIGVDVVDKTCASYSVARITKRWPMVVFFHLLNIAGINAQVLYSTVKPQNAPRRRITFLKELALELMKEHLLDRSDITSLPSDIKAFLATNYPKSTEAQAQTSQDPPAKKMRGACKMCHYKKKSNTTKTCAKCSTFICKLHSATVCSNCANPLPEVAELDTD